MIDYGYQCRYVIQQQQLLDIIILIHCGTYTLITIRSYTGTTQSNARVPTHTARRATQGYKFLAGGPASSFSMKHWDTRDRKPGMRDSPYALRGLSPDAMDQLNTAKCIRFCPIILTMNLILSERLSHPQAFPAAYQRESRDVCMR